jgi:hypothetical protein
MIVVGSGWRECFVGDCPICILWFLVLAILQSDVVVFLEWGIFLLALSTLLMSLIGVIRIIGMRADKYFRVRQHIFDQLS